MKALIPSRPKRQTSDATDPVEYRDDRSATPRFSAKPPISDAVSSASSNGRGNSIVVEVDEGPRCLIVLMEN